jgi:protein-tyrosine phosphatase
VKRVLFVCMGNICRSPTAEGVALWMATQQGIADRFEFDSAGTHDYHIGEPPDRRTQAAAKARGVDLSMLRARQVADGDFERFDLILAMDRANLYWLQARCPEAQRHKLSLLLEYAENHPEEEVPRPVLRRGGGLRAGA